MFGAIITAVLSLKGITLILMFKMHEVVVPNDAEYYWQKALSGGIKKIIVSFRGNEDRLFGRVFEHLGVAVIFNMYPPPAFILTTPQETARLRSYIREDEQEGWQPRFPDGIVFQKIAPDGLRIMSLVEYKAPNVRHIEDQRYQFQGFGNLLELLGHNNASRGKGILRKFFNQQIRQLEIPQTVSYLYVVPKDRTAFDIPTSLHGQENFKQIIFPQSSQDIRRRIRQIGAPK